MSASCACSKGMSSGMFGVWPSETFGLSSAMARRTQPR